MSIRSVLFQESDTVEQGSISISFEFKNVPEGRNPGGAIVITPITVGTWFRLKPHLALIEKDDLEKIAGHKGEEGDMFSSDIRDVMMKYDETMFEIVCIGIHNRKGNMPEWFKTVLMNSCTWQDVYILFNAIVFRLNSMSFFNTITAMKAVSPLGEEEIIALQENMKSWISRAVSDLSQLSTKHSDIHTNRR